jgi:hypothetical protein
MQNIDIFDEVIGYTGPLAYLHVSLLSKRAGKAYEKQYLANAKLSEAITLVPLRNSDLSLFNYMVTKCWLLLEVPGSTSRSRLSLAVRNGNIDYIKTYCSNSDIPRLPDLIDFAAQENQGDMVKYLWSRRGHCFDKLSQDAFGPLVIYEFAEHSNDEMIQWACKKGFYITDRAITCCIPDNIPMAKFLLSRIEPRELSLDLILVLVASGVLGDICETMPHLLATFPASGAMAAITCLGKDMKLFYMIQGLYTGDMELLFFKRLRHLVGQVCENNGSNYYMNLLKELYPTRFA